VSTATYPTANIHGLFVSKPYVTFGISALHSCKQQYEIPSDRFLVALYEVKNLNTLCGEDVRPSVCNLLSETKLRRIFVKFGLCVLHEMWARVSFVKIGPTIQLYFITWWQSYSYNPHLLSDLVNFHKESLHRMSLSNSELLVHVNEMTSTRVPWHRATVWKYVQSW
jgi:hypothetical protein